MGVVQTAVESLSGSLRLETELGTGTRFVLELPVTLAITDALIAKVGTETFAVPQGTIREVIEVPVAALLQLEHNEMTPVPRRRASGHPAVPDVRAARCDRRSPAPLRDRHRRFPRSVSPSTASSVSARSSCASITDALVKVDGISGATDLGDGHVVLILDPAVLVRHTRERPDRRAGAAHDASR